MPRGRKAQLKAQAKKSLTQILDEAVEEQVAARTERRPGQVVHGIKTPWTRADVDRAFPIVELIPEETIRVTYNGVGYQLIQDIQMVVPSIVKDIYLRHRRAVRRGTVLEGVVVEGGAGPLPPEF